MVTTDHCKIKTGENMDWSKIHDAIIDRARSRSTSDLPDGIYCHNHHIIPLCEDKNSTETVRVTIKEHMVLHHLRYKMNGVWGNLAAYKFLKGSDHTEEANFLIRSNAGKLGGRTTRSKNIGIYSPDYDRGAQTRKNWNTPGVMDKAKEYMYGNDSLGGTTTRKNESGIFDPDYQHLRAEWARIGADALTKSGNRRGCATKEWIAENKESHDKNLAKARILGGKKVGSLSWWTDGKSNKRAKSSPGLGWRRGMTKNTHTSEKFARSGEGRTWISNGRTSKFLRKGESIPHGWKKGRV